MSLLFASRASLLWLCSLVVACSTPISPYSPLADEDEAQEELPEIDAGSARDSGVRDASARDAGTSARDAGTSASTCGRIANAPNYVTLVDDDCASRAARACAAPGQSSQVALNQLIQTVAARCGVQANVALGVVFSPSGCPDYFGANGPDLRGRISQCLQNEFETWRISCRLTCAGTSTFAP